MISDIYRDNTALNGDAVSKEKINVYRIVHENNSRCAYPNVENFKKYSIKTRLMIIANIGATVTSVL